MSRKKWGTFNLVFSKNPMCLHFFYFLFYLNCYGFFIF
nr:MAG TPA: hypothetical protein [Caudoviricetes sp.]